MCYAVLCLEADVDKLFAHVDRQKSSMCVWGNTFCSSFTYREMEVHTDVVELSRVVGDVPC